MFLRSLRLGNYRSFLDTGNIDLRPIVVLVGANSAGKSSLLRFFPLLRQTYATPTRGPLLWYGNDVDLDGFSGVLCRSAPEPEITVEMELGFRPRWPLFRDADFLIPVGVTTRLRQFEQRTYVASITVTAAGCGARLEFDDTGSATRFALEENVAGFLTEELQNKLLHAHGGSNNQLIPTLQPPEDHARDRVRWNQLSWLHEAVSEFLRFKGISETMLAPLDETQSLDEAVKSSPAAEFAFAARFADTWFKENESLQSQVPGLALTPDDQRLLKNLQFLYALPETLQRLNASLEKFAGALAYLGPFRQGPRRFYRLNRELAVEHIDPHGANLAMFLGALSQERQAAFAEWTERHFGFAVEAVGEGAHITLSVVEAGRRFNLVDMGYGISQLLPIVAQCWAASVGENNTGHGQPPSLVAVEQPELHLHPHHQQNLADMLAAMVKTDIAPRCVVETHSKILLERLGELIELGSLSREDVAVLLVERNPETGVSTVTRTEFDERGVLRNWPVGFFAP